MGFGFGIAADTPAASSGLPLAIQDVLIVGASIMNQSMDETNIETLSNAAYSNSAITVINRAISGWLMQDLKNNIDAILLDYIAITDMLVFIHIGGGDVSLTRTFDTVSEPVNDLFVSNLQYIVDAIKTAGLIPIVSDITFRRYIKTTPHVTELNEEDGSLPYNENLIYPMSKVESSTYTTSSGEAITQFYTLMYNNPKFLENDGIHPNADGELALAKRFVDTVLRYNFTGSYSSPISKRHSPNQSANDVRFSLGLAEYQTNILWVSTSTTNTGSNTNNMYSVNGEDSGYRIQWLSTFTGVNQDGVETGDDSGFMLDTQIRNSYFMNFGETNTVEVSGLDDNCTYTFRMTGSRDAVDDRQTKITLDTVEKIYNTSSGGVGNTTDGVVYTGVVPSSGIVTFTVEGVTTFAYLGGIDIIKE